ncbi:hypothetical protein DL89DRAFT_28535 [Linderina pennispora]|uniref:Uncharacterized protein n=1 Tax=Linderina pennispora TaxID=61395 RepID=A0A1Y1W496_9FUNG|nr:uncharacterized protein DL89DRAFT_28535 [Linderina pennispora]ORX68238.1 hypothetical protein DL89DRAFT_28535 [Linderina pennispora]
MNGYSFWHSTLCSQPRRQTWAPGRRSQGSKEISNTQRAVIRGTDLFVAVGSEVRWISLKACKDAYVQFESTRLGVASSIDETQSDYKATSQQDAIQHVPWYRVLGSALGFEIRRLVCNKSGKLLAVVGRRQVAVVTLPGPESPNRAGVKGAFAAARMDKPSDEFDGACVSCASKIIGGTAIGRQGAQAGEGRGARVADALWHSMSSSDSHLVVLLSSGVVKGV